VVPLDSEFPESWSDGAVEASDVRVPVGDNGDVTLGGELELKPPLLEAVDSER